MHKIPVGKTISGAYEFAFAGFLTVLGTVWLPYLILFALDGGLIYLVMPDAVHHWMHGQFEPTDFLGLARINGLMTLLALVVRAMVTVGLQERALGRVSGPTFAYFSLGAAVWRFLAALVLAIIALVVLIIVTVIVAVFVCGYVAQNVAHYGPAIAVAVGIVASFWCIYAAVRLTFFLPAVVVAEESIDLVRSWELGGGNFWRIVAVAFVVFVPFVIVIGVVWGAVMGPFIPFDLLSHLHPHMTPDEIRNLMMSFEKRIFDEIRVALPFVAVFSIVEQLILIGLSNGMVAKAYLGATEQSGG